jgi:predicted PurR-regulated permease PerM
MTYHDDSLENHPSPSDRALSPVDWIRLAVLIVLTVILIGLSVALALPFLPAITWAVALAILAWPVHRWISRRIGKRGVAAGISTAGVAAVILGTSLFITYQIASETASVAKGIDDGEAEGGALWKKAESVPVLGPAIGWLERVGLDVRAAAQGTIKSYVDSTSSIAQGSVMAVVQFLLAMFILYYLFRDRDAFLDRVRGLLPLSKAESDLLMTRAADSVHATLYATVVTSLIDSVAFGLTFWWTGVPAPVLWSVIMFLLSLLPILGAGLVWAPATVYLAMNGNWMGAAALVVVGLATAGYVDNVLYARMAGGRMRMHNVPVLIAFLGGLAIFGTSGMILGPAVLAVTEATLEVWKQRMSPVDGTISGAGEDADIITIGQAAD